MLYGTPSYVQTMANISHIIRNILNELSQHAAKAIEEQCKMESHPFTQDEASLTKTTKTLLRRMLEYRQKEVIDKAPRGTGDLSGFLSRDEYDQELNLIAHVLAYINVAYKRFGDMIPMRVEEKLQNALAETVRKQLMNKFLIGEGIEERCRAYMEDSPEIIARRRDILRKREVLRMAEQEIRKFQGSGSFNHDLE